MYLINAAVSQSLQRNCSRYSVKMKFLVVLPLVLALAYARYTSNVICDGVHVNGQYYDKKFLQTGLDRPFLLAVDYETDTLYFNYNIAENEYKSARLNLRTNEIKDIDGIPNGFSHAVDSDHHILYVGTKDGIYAYNYKTEQSEFYGAKGHFIWTLFFKDEVLYYSKYPSQEFYTYSNGEPMRFKDLEDTKVHYFVLDDDNNMFFSNDTGLYKQASGSTEAVLYQSFRTWDIRALTLDLYGNVYAGIHDGVYRVKRNQVKVEKILPVHDLFGLAFDGDNNIIYSDSSSVVQLKANKEKDC